MNRNTCFKWKALLKRALSLFLTICLLTSLLPVSFAADEIPGEEISGGEAPINETPGDEPPSENGGRVMHGYLSNIEFTIGGENYPGFTFDPQQSKYSSNPELLFLCSNSPVKINLTLSNGLTEAIKTRTFVDELKDSNKTSNATVNVGTTTKTSTALNSSKLYALDPQTKHTLILVIGPTTFYGNEGEEIPTDADVYYFEFSILPVLGVGFYDTEDGITQAPYDSGFEYDIYKYYLASLEGNAPIPTIHTTAKKIFVSLSNYQTDFNESTKVCYQLGEAGDNWIKKEGTYQDRIPIDLVSDRPEGTDCVTLRVKAVSCLNHESFYQFKIYLVEDYTPTIITHPVGFECDKGEKRELSVAAAPAEGSSAEDISYQWFRTGDENAVGGGYSIPGATSLAYIPPTDNAGTWYYYCAATATVNGVPYSAYSNVAKCTVHLNKVNDFQVIRPLGEVKYNSFLEFGEFKTQYRVGEPFDPIFIGLSPIVESGVKYSFKVYHGTTASIAEAEPCTTAIVSYAGHSNLDSEKFQSQYYAVRDETPYPVGDHYIFLEVTAVDETNPENQSNTAVSSVKLTVIEEGFQWTKGGDGTASDPYLIKDPSDLEYIRKVVNEWNNRLKGSCFKFANDITLPEGWTPIGSSSSAKELRVFSGQIDGDGHTLTVPDGGRPLLNLVSDAVIKNLNIKGTRINGCGLIDDYFIDYGSDGVYDTGCPEAVTMENVHLLTGSQTRRSGFMEGSGSGANTITLRNCTVDPGVVIGYDGNVRGIGSFVGGSFNGQMEGCYSAATVKGISRVGGLAGGKGQSMGLCSFTNCGFTGTIEASGEWVGGIIGGGYVSDSAPNTMVVSFNNCFVNATISAANNVGGIFGGEGGVRDAWNKCILSNSTFYGTITATGSNVGGIIGYYNGVNTFQEMENNYFCEQTGRTLNAIGNVGKYNIGSGKAPFASQAAADEWYAKAGTAIAPNSYDAADVVQKLNSGATSLGNWVVKGGFPAHSEDPVLIRLQINGTWPDQQLGQPLNTAGITYTGIWTKGKPSEDIPAGNVTITGYDSSIHGIQTLTAAYKGVRQEFTVVVKRPEGNIKVSFALKGDTAHDKPTSTDPNDSNGTHTLANGGLTDWIPATEVEVSSNATVLDVIKQVLEAQAQAGHTYAIANETGNYISAITWDGVTLGEFTNGTKSGWKYTLNGKYPDLGVSEQFLNEKDIIVFHYTDDYTIDGTSSEGPGDDDPGTTVTEYGPYLTGVLSWLKTNVPSPKVSSAKGEWAVLAQARGGTLTDAAKQEYLTNLWQYADERDGVLDETGYKHTEYSRVILALTSIGVDASAVKNGTKTYKFVQPLLKNNCAQAIEQGNNGTAFALIALDSGGYLNNSDGNKARATLIDELCKHQKTDGSWSIDPSDSTPNTDVTAMAIQALAPYYLDQTRYSALSAKTSYDALKKTVDLALSYLSNQQSSVTGGFSSPEADAQVIVALAALGQDAGQYKKGDSRSVLSDLLSYAVGKAGANAPVSFSSKRDGPTNQMSTEQAAYALVAYDRFKNSRNSLYNMTDVTLSGADLNIKLTQYTIKVSAGEGGTISPSTTTVTKGESKTFTITPNTGYQIKGVKADDVPMGAPSAYTFTNVTDDHTISAEFEKASGTFTITANSGTGGTISPSATVQAGSSRTFTITPSTGYKIVDVIVDGYSMGAQTSYTFTKVTSNHTITASFALATGDITVYFTLMGDSSHGNGSSVHTLSNGRLQTWISRQAVTVSKGAKVYDVFTKVLNQHGYRYIGAESNYVETIITPGGVRLSEFTNGRNSGWMYTVNGVHPEYGLQEWTVYNGDEIIWHYTDDYTQERGGTGSSNTNNAAQLTPTIYGSSSTVSSADMTNAVYTALNSGSGTVLVAPLGSAGASTLTVDLPTGTLYTAANNGVGVTVQSGAGIVTIPSGTLTGIANTANGNQVSITATSRNSQQGVNLLSGRMDVTAVQLANSSVTEVTMRSGSQSITSWGGRSITISLPVNGTNFSAGNRYTVYQVSSNGSVETHSGYCSRQNGSLYVEISTTHLSTFVTVPNQTSTNNTYLPFRDVSVSDWFYDDVVYAYNRGLFNGDSPTAFAPYGRMNRAMLVTVLHRFEGTPATARTASFTDVASGQWFTNGVAWASGIGVVNGKGNGKFDPYGNITREEIATILYRYAKIKGWDVTASANLYSFNDGARTSDWATRAMQWAYAKGIINGKGGGTLDPGGYATRAEVAAMMRRFIAAY